VVIFVTAFDEHAVNAFEVHALDYLLKPFKPARLRSAVDRARRQLAKQDSTDDPTARLLAMLETRTKPAEAEPAHVTRFAVRDRDRTRFVKVTDIDWIEASGNYVVIHAGKENFVLRETLAAVEAQVSPKEFFRLNRSALARLDRIREVEPTFNDEHVVVLLTGSRIPLTRGVRELQERLKFA
jgi:two-component system LytT family response regulator